jgi:hypothetical protein
MRDHRRSGMILGEFPVPTAALPDINRPARPPLAGGFCLRHIQIETYEVDPARESESSIFNVDLRRSS